MKKDVEKAKLSLENKIRILQSGGHITKLTAEESLVLKIAIRQMFENQK
mgnify:CR=1 FL=1